MHKDRDRGRERKERGIEGKRGRKRETETEGRERGLVGARKERRG